MTDIQKQLAEALEMIAEETSDEGARECALEALAAHRQQEERKTPDVPLALLKNIRYLLSNAKLPSGMLIVGGRLKHPPTVCAETLAELETIITSMDAAHGIKGE
jgi:hypothetical protein